MTTTNAFFDVLSMLGRKKHPGTGDPTTDAIYGSISAFLVLFAGLMSGLTLGLMSLDTVELEVLKRSGSEKEKSYAERILPVVSRPHLLLVTLLTCNAAAAEALPLFLDRLFNPVSAVVMSVTVVLLVGEIIPQALCSRYGLAIGATSAWFVRALMVVCYPLAAPIAWVLDKLLGHQTALFRRAQLKALVEVHDKKQHLGGDLDLDEVRVITGALDAAEKTGSQVMTPLNKVFMLPADALLDEDTFSLIARKGHSRIPIHRPGNREEVLGVLLVKDLLMLDKSAKKSVQEWKIRTLPVLPERLPLYDLLKLFEMGRSHMAVLVKRKLDAPYTSSDEEDNEDSVDNSLSRGMPSFMDDFNSQDDGKRLIVGFNCTAVGIVTIEDVIEELLQQEILDETDLYMDNEATKKVNAALVMRNIPKRLRKMAAKMLPRIGTPAGIDYTMGTQPHLRAWHSNRSLSQQQSIIGEKGTANAQEDTCGMDAMICPTCGAVTNTGVGTSYSSWPEIANGVNLQNQAEDIQQEIDNGAVSRHNAAQPQQQGSQLDAAIQQTVSVAEQEAEDRHIDQGQASVLGDLTIPLLSNVKEGSHKKRWLN